MKYLVLLFFVGFVSAASINSAPSFDENELVEDVAVATSLIHVLELDATQPTEDGGEIELPQVGEKLRERFEKILETIKEAIDRGIQVKKELLVRAREHLLLLKYLKSGMSDKVKQLLEKVKETAFICLLKLAHKFEGELKVYYGADGLEITLASVEKFKENFREMYIKIKDALTETVDKETLKIRIEKLFGKGTQVAEKLLTLLKEKSEKSKNKLLELIDTFLSNNERSNTRSDLDLWEKVRDYFDKIKLEIKRKYLTFGEWVRENIGNALKSLKNKSDKAKKIAEELKENAESLSKEILAEGLEFLRPYRNQLGELWDQLKNSVKDEVEKMDKSD